jgi:hypothetical protein
MKFPMTFVLIVMTLAVLAALVFPAPSDETVPLALTQDDSVVQPIPRSAAWDHDRARIGS